VKTSSVLSADAALLVAEVELSGGRYALLLSLLAVLVLLSDEALLLEAMFEAVLPHWFSSSHL
jgi:hypothetical protein